MAEPAETPELERGRFASPTRHGDEIRRRPRQDNREVHRLLQDFEAIGCPLTPRFLGIAEDGSERLSYIAGETGYPPLSEAIRSDAALVSVARAIRTVHDASTGFVPSPQAQWHGYDLAAPAKIDCIGHGDLAPWNVVFSGSEVVGVIDWDAAGPSSRLWDLGYAAHQFVPFHPDADLAGWGWPGPPDRRARLRLFADAYGGVEPADLVDHAILRLISIGGFLDRAARRGDPAFAVEARENHARGYRKAAASLIGLRDQLL